MARGRVEDTEYAAVDIPVVGFEVNCDFLITNINTQFDTIVSEVNTRREELIRSVEKLKTEYSNWIKHIETVKEQASTMRTAAEQSNIAHELRAINDKLMENLEEKLASMNQDEMYFKEREVQFHLDVTGVTKMIKGLGSIRLKQTLDFFKEYKMVNKPLSVKFDRNTNSYYVMTSRNVQILDENFNPIQSFPILPPVDKEISRTIVGGIAVGADRVYITISSHSLIQEYERNGHLERSVGKRGFGEGELMWPEGIEVHPGSRRVYVCEYENDRVQVFSNGMHQFFIGDTDNKTGQLRRPKSLAITKHGKVLVLHMSQPCVNVYKDDGEFLGQFGCLLDCGGLRGLNWLATAHNGVEIGSTVTGRVSIMIYRDSLIIELNAVQHAKCDANLGGVAVGGDNKIVVCDTVNKRLVYFDLSVYSSVFPMRK